MNKLLRDKKNIIFAVSTIATVVILFLSIYSLIQRSKTQDINESKNDNLSDTGHFESDNSSFAEGSDASYVNSSDEHSEDEQSNDLSLPEESTEESEPQSPNSDTSGDTSENSKVDTSIPEINVSDSGSDNTSIAYIDKVETSGTEKESEKLEDILQPAVITLLRPVASGTLVKSNDSAIIDYSNTKDGYVMVKFTAQTTSRLKVQVKGSTTTYTYNLTPGEWAVFPLSDGNGSYSIKVFKNVTDNRYSTVLSLSCEILLDNEFAPFLRPNQYVNYENAVNTMQQGASLVTGKDELLEKVAAIYNFVVNNISYDYEKAATVQSGYLPDLDAVLAARKGICFDYAALMAGMLRSQNIPCKLVVGYAGEEYHAWISVWSETTGWIDGAIFFDGISWQRMDPTFASTSGKSDFGNINYTVKYIY